MPINNPITSDPEAKEMSQHPKLEGDIIIPVLFIFFFVVVFKDEVSLWRSGCPGTQICLTVPPDC